MNKNACITTSILKFRSIHFLRFIPENNLKQSFVQFCLTYSDLKWIQSIPTAVPPVDDVHFIYRLHLFQVYSPPWILKKGVLTMDTSLAITIHSVSARPVRVSANYLCWFLKCKIFLKGRQGTHENTKCFKNWPIESCISNLGIK